MTRIIITDDSALARMFIRRCLEIAGPELSEFIELDNGAKALECLGSTDVDLVVTDLTMPQMDGLELLRQMSENPTMQNTPVLVVTSAGNTAQHEEIRSLGAKVLQKPVTPPMIAEALAELLPESV